LVIPYSSRRGGSRAIFIARLRQCASEFVPRPSWRNLLERLANFASALVAPRIAWAGALFALSLAIFLARVAVSPTVSANAVLERARISEKASRASVQHPVIYQRLRIHSQGGTVTRTIYRDALSGRRSDSSDASQVTLADLQTRMQDVNLDWQDPLSIASFIEWHGSLTEKTDEVTRSGDGFVVVRTKVLNGPLSEVDLTLRDGDYHAIGETLRFQDENIEMSEVDFSVLAFESVDPAVFGPSSSPQPAALPVRPAVSAPSISDLVRAEAEARVALHTLGADLGEPIDISSDGKEVLVSGLVDTSERKQDLLQALQTIPHLRTSLVSATEVAERADALALKDDNPVVAVESAPLLERELRATFPDAEARTNFVNDVLATSMNAAGRAWSLRRLSDRYTNDISSRLDVLNERTVELLIRDDAKLLQQELNKLQLLLTQLKPEMSADRSTGTEVKADDTEPEDWHWGVDSAFSESQRIQNDVSVLFSGVDNRSADTPAILGDLLLAIKRMDKRLPVLCREVGGDFFTAAERHVGIQGLGDSQVQK
jgi:hypothetical protein